jgi:hypothetical protein
LPPETTLDGMDLHPAMLDGALQAAGSLFTGAITPSLPLAVELVQVVSPCTREMVAWARLGATAQVDIDLCDRQGNVCVQLRGVTYAAAPASGIALPAPETAAAPASAMRKPAKVSLAAPA